MPISTRPVAVFVVIGMLACGLAGCGTNNEKLAAGLTDVLPW